MNFKSRFYNLIPTLLVFCLLSSCFPLSSTNQPAAISTQSSASSSINSLSSDLGDKNEEEDNLSEAGWSEGVPDYQRGIWISGWPGKMISLPPDSPYDNYLSWMPEGSGETGIEGNSFTIDSKLMALNDSHKTFLFWGLQTCGSQVDDYHHCKLLVTDFQPADSHALDTIPIKGWAGQVKAVPQASAFPAEFILEGTFPMRFYLSGDEQLIQQALKSSRNIRIWGALYSDEASSDLRVIKAARIDLLPDLSLLSPNEASDETFHPTEEISDWLTYNAEEGQISFDYPASSTLQIYGMKTDPDGRVLKIIPLDEFQSEETKDVQFVPLCTTLEYRWGYIAISSAANQALQYASCGRNINYPGRLNGKEIQFTLSGKTQTATGFEFIGAGASLLEHYEIYSFMLSDGSKVEFGSASLENGSFYDYEEDTRESLLQILDTISFP